MITLHLYISIYTGLDIGSPATGTELSAASLGTWGSVRGIKTASFAWRLGPGSLRLSPRPSCYCLGMGLGAMWRGFAGYKVALLLPRLMVMSPQFNTTKYVC